MSRLATKIETGERIPTTVRLEKPLHDELRKAVYEGRARSFQEIAESAFPLWLGLPPPTEPETTILDLGGLCDEDQERVRRYATALARGKSRPMLDVIDTALAGVEYRRSQEQD
jgi:hypothetical protein